LWFDLLLDPFKDRSNPLSATNTHGDQTILTVCAMQLMNRFGGNRCASTTYGVTKRYCTTVHIGLGRI
jgi:hypothetical protein